MTMQILPLSLRWRLTWLVIGMQALVLLLTFAFIRMETYGEARVETRATSRLVMSLLPDELNEPDTGAPRERLEVAGVLDAIRHLRHVRMRIVAADGDVIAESPDGVAGLASPARKPFRIDGVERGSYEVYPDSRDEFIERRASYWTTGLIGASLAALLVGLVYWVIGRAMGPMREIGVALRSLEQGDLAVRMQPAGAQELRWIAPGFNRMASSLQSLVAERESLTTRLLELEDTTRNGFARDLHDDLSPYLIAIRPHVSLLSRAASNDPALAPYGETVDAIRNHLDQTLEHIRYLLDRISLPQLESEGLREALRRTVELRREWLTRPVDIRLHDTGSRAGFTRTIDASVLRLVQEAITNALKHSACSYIDIRIDCPGNTTLLIDVTNDGVDARAGSGKRAEARVGETVLSGGLGVRGMRDRVLALGGRFSAGTQRHAADEAGVAPGIWQIHATIPLRNANDPGELTRALH